MGLNCEEMDSVTWIASTYKLLDDNLHTCDSFTGNNDPFVYIWVYIGETLGPIHIDVIGNYSCWPHMALRVMGMTPDGRVEYCYSRSGMDVHGINFKACRYYCRCKQCGNYLVIQLPIRSNATPGNNALCEIRLIYVLGIRVASNRFIPNHIQHFCTRITDLMYGFAQAINCCHGWQTCVRSSNHFNPISLPQHVHCYHSDRPHSCMQQSTYLSKTTTNNSGMAITVIEVYPGLINKYHMRPVLTFPVLEPVCLQAVATVMI